jgi:hypothetical protein
LLVHFRFSFDKTGHACPVFWSGPRETRELGEIDGT